MTIRTRRNDKAYSHTNGKDWTGDIKRAITSQEMPGLPAPYQQVDDSHWQLWSDDIIATLWYDRLNGLWNVRFDWPDIPQMQFKRDTPDMEMRERILEAILVKEST